MKTKIKIEELRIGNFLQLPDGTQGQIVKVERFADSNIVAVKNDKSVYSYEVEKFEPIPITSKWLEKLGFKRVSDYRNYNVLQGSKVAAYKYRYINVVISDKRVIVYNGFSESYKFVCCIHDLQNICYIDGIELKGGKA